MPQTTALANQNEGTLFNGDFARDGLGATPIQSKKGTKNYHLKHRHHSLCSVNKKYIKWFLKHKMYR